MDIQQSPTAPKRANAAERRRKAVALRIAGATYEQIGRELGITSQAAWKHVTIALADVRQKTAEDADVLRVTELARLDAAQASIWPRVVQGDNQAIDRFLRISKRRGEITGIDAPTKIAPTDPTGKLMFIIQRGEKEHGTDDNPSPCPA